MSNPRSLMSLKRLEPPAKHHDKGHRWSSQDERKVCQGLWHQRWCVWDPWLRAVVSHIRRISLVVAHRSPRRTSMLCCQQRRLWRRWQDTSYEPRTDL